MILKVQKRIASAKTISGNTMLKLYLIFESTLKNQEFVLKKKCKLILTGK